MLLVAQIGGEVAAEGAALLPPDIPFPDAVRHLCFEVEALAVGIKIIVQRVVQLVAVHAQQLVAAGEAEGFRPLPASTRSILMAMLSPHSFCFKKSKKGKALRPPLLYITPMCHQFCAN